MTTKNLKSKHVYLAVISAGLLVFLGSFANKSTNVMYPAIVRQFHQPLNITQWISTAYMLANTLSITTTAYLLRQYSARTIERVAAFFFIIGTFLCGPALNLPMLFIGRAFQGISDGLCVAVMFFIIFTQVPQDRLGLMSGVSGALMALACSLGPTYGGWLCDTISWRAVFWSILPIGFLSLICGEIFIRNTPQGNSHAFSYTSMVFISLSFFCFDYSATMMGSTGFQWQFWGLFALGILFLVGFIVANNRGKTRLFYLDIFRIPAIRWATFNYFLMQIIAAGIMAVIPTYAQYILKTNALLSGFILFPGAFLGAVTSPLSGKWADHKGSRYPVIAGGLLQLCGACIMLICQRYLTVVFLLILYIISRVSYNLMYTNTIAYASLIVPEKHKLDVNSVFNTAEDFGGSLGVDLFMSIFALTQHNGLGMFTGGTIIFSLIIGISVIMLLCIKQTYKR